MAPAFLEQNVHVLAGEKLQALAGRQFEVDDDHVRGGARDLVHACRQGSDRNILDRSDFPALQAQVASRHGAAKEREAGLAVGLTEYLERGFAVRQFAAQNLASTGATNPIPTAVRKTQSLTQCGFENCFVRLGVKGVPAWLNIDLKTH